MRTLIALLLVLFCSSACTGGCPVISRVLQPFEGTVSLAQHFDLWVDSPDRWRLYFAYPAGVTANGPLWEGQGAGYESRLVDFEIDPALLGAGLHHLKLRISMDGAQSVLGLPCADQYWILPLNGAHVRIVNERGQQFEITNEEWVLLEEGVEVFFNGSRLQRQPAQTRSRLTAVDGGLHWVTRELHLEAGEEAEVVLALTGPMPAGKLEIVSGLNLVVGGRWHLGGQVLIVEESQSNRIILSLPALGPGEHRLRGSTKALLPTAADESFIEAYAWGQQAVLKVHIERDWFDFSHLHFLDIQGDAPFSHPLLMPDGSLRYPGKGRTLAVRSNRLTAVIPIAFPSHPVWVGVPLSENLIPLSQSAVARSQFVLPVFVWDGDFSWRLIASRKDWLVDLSAANSRLFGKLGPLFLKAADGRASVVNQLNYYEGSNGWRWWRGYSGTGGAWLSDIWALTFEIPPGRNPSFSLQYARDGFLAKISSDDALLSFENGGLNYGLRWKTRGFWVRALNGAWRLDLNPNRLKFQASGQLFNYSLRTSLGQKWELRLNSERTEFYVRSRQWQGEELGVRFRIPQAAGARRALTTAAAQIKNGTLLFELEHHEGRQFSSSLVFYVRGSVRGAGEEVRFNSGAGLIYTPVPQLFGNLDWDHELGWRWRAGAVIPFVQDIE